MKRIFLFAAFLTCLHGEIIDRIAFTVDKEVITEGQVDEEIRVTALLNHQPLKRDIDQRRAASDRLIQQTLIRREMELSHYPLPSAEDVAAYYQQIQKQYGGAKEFENALSEYSLRKDVVLEHLSFQLTTLRFIAYRFEPDVDVSDQQVDDTYQKQVNEWKQTHTGTPPSLEASRETIKKAIIDEQTDDAFSAWLEASRKQVQITYMDPQLQ